MIEQSVQTHPRLARDDWSGRLVYIAPARSARPVVNGDGCPFCAGGDEAPHPFVSPYAFANRWPAIAGRCEVIVHSDDHDDFGTMSPDRIHRVVDLWAERSAGIGSLPDVSCVLVFENRGAEAGATVAHPHSQLFGLPIRPVHWVSGDHERCPGCTSSDPGLTVQESAHCRVEVPQAPLAPFTVRIVTRRHVNDLAGLQPVERASLAHALATAVRALDGLVARPMPYHLWVQQELRPGATAHLAVHLVGLLRSPSRLLNLGAAETATGLRFTPIDPYHVAAQVRAVMKQAR
ncbi:HIT family protein [Micromonospora craniellae]|uniref:Galactose-1-phosphate uridyl transferase N-terminal domain-containing protein n=1 Tax=Micromonospora craniellae TaxID=2294034 RepID=A0A372FRQ5_9ACTN|nr:hypothetical protein [Micromonospora craniellae]QOC93476.1 hypothetical protein ID554_07370 [Micromonospora craniellae]RFS43467.1 hypothetical protein D0Q02_27685 [Micromonospora craniellae]